MTQVADILLTLRKWEVRPLSQSQGEINQAQAGVQRAQPLEVVVSAIIKCILRGPFHTTVISG